MDNELRDFLIGLGVDLEASQDAEAITVPCPVPDCRKENPDRYTARLNPSAGYHCMACGARGSVADYQAALTVSRPSRLPVPAGPVETVDAQLVEPETEPPAAQPAAILRPQPLSEPHHTARKRRGLGEHVIISLLAIVFLLAGLGAAALSGFANYQAFSGMVADPLQARIWGVAGVIASVIGLAGFTFVWWHIAGRRWGEAVRAGLIALAGAATSVVGTQLYMQTHALAAVSASEAAAANRAIIEAQITDWRAQLAGIPPETRTVEGLENYIAEVERVGRTHQKPYRDAKVELDLAKRRDDLEAKIETANRQLLGLADGPDTQPGPERQSLPAWFFALMLEIFSSQATSIAAVALLILSAGRRDDG